VSTNLKSLPEGLRNTKCKKGTLPIRPPIPFIPPADLHEKRETKQIKVNLPNGTKFQMPTYRTGNNKEYLIHIIAILIWLSTREQLPRSRKPLQPLLQLARR
jgi:hypothetical protein